VSFAVLSMSSSSRSTQTRSLMLGHGVRVCNLYLTRVEDGVLAAASNRSLCSILSTAGISLLHASQPVRSKKVLLINLLLGQLVLTVLVIIVEICVLCRCLVLLSSNRHRIAKINGVGLLRYSLLLLPFR